jgi:hypothetical protein
MSDLQFISEALIVVMILMTVSGLVQVALLTLILREISFLPSGHSEIVTFTVETDPSGMKTSNEAERMS